MNLRTRVLTGLACLLTWSCADEPPAGIVLKITTDLPQPRFPDDKEQQINSLRVRVWKGDVAPARPGEALVWKDFALGQGKLLLPSEMGLSRGGGGEGALTIEVVASLGSRRVVSRTVKESFKSGRTKDVLVALNRECLGIACPTGLTCVPDFGCTEPTLPTRPALPRGKDCACGSFFPICVGAFWNYDVFDSNNVVTRLTHVFSFFGPLKDDRHGLKGKHGFLQFRSAVTDFARRWIQVEGEEPAPQRIWWLKDEWFDVDEKVTKLTYYTTRKLRFDETKRVPNEEWPDKFDQFDYSSPDAQEPPPVLHRDAWRVVSTDMVVREVPSQPPSRFPSQFLKSALCHERKAMTVGGPPPTTKYFCFVKGIGKVYELTPAPREEEVLVNFKVPNCGV